MRYRVRHRRNERACPAFPRRLSRANVPSLAAGGCGRAFEADLGLPVGEPNRAVDPDGGIAGVRDDDQRARAEFGEAVLASVPDQGARQALAASRRMGRDILVAGDPGAVREQAELGGEPTIAKRAEPGPVAYFGETARLRRAALDEGQMRCSLLGGRAGQPQFAGLRPVVVAASGR